MRPNVFIMPSIFVGDKIDHGACINTLTTYKPTPLAKGNGPANSIIVQVTKA